MDLENIHHFSDLKWISIKHPSRKNIEDIYQITSNPSYMSLSSGFDRENMRGMEFIPPFIGLKALELGYIELQDKDLSHAYSLKNLEFLTLSGNKDFTGTGLQFINDKTKMWYLDLQDANIDNSGLNEIADCGNLEVLYLSDNRNPNLTNKGFKQLELLQNLRQLDLHNTNIDDSDFIKICNLKNLEALWIGRTKVSDKGMKYIENLRNLVQLNLYGTQITNKGLENLIKLPKLEHLGIEDDKEPSKYIKNRT